MAAVCESKEVMTSLKIAIAKSPISFIELPKDLRRLKITLDTEYKQTGEFFKIRRLVESYIRPPKQEVGVLEAYDNTIEVGQCVNINNELKRLHQKHPYIKEWYYDELKDQGLVHTVQVPILSLKKAGFISDSQMEQLTNFIMNNIT